MNDMNTVILLYYVKSTNNEESLIGVFKNIEAAERRIKFLTEWKSDLWCRDNFHTVVEDIKE